MKKKKGESFFFFLDKNGRQKTLSLFPLFFYQNAAKNSPLRQTQKG